jgi:hypothetical protein
MVVHQGAAVLHGTTSVQIDDALVRVTRPDELLKAFAQRTKQVVIDNPELERAFSTLEYCERQRTIRFLGISTLAAALVALALAYHYKLDFGWRSNWKMDRIEGKITFTPPQRP